MLVVLLGVNCGMGGGLFELALLECDGSGRNNGLGADDFANCLIFTASPSAIFDRPGGNFDCCLKAPGTITLSRG